MTNIGSKEAERLFECHAALVAYANRRLDIVDSITDGTDVRGSRPQEVQRMREALYENPGLIHGFVWENPADLDEDDRALVASWRAFERGRFLVRRFTREYAEFLDLASPHRLFAVNALHDSFRRMGVDPPQIVRAVLLPYGDRIVSDGHLYADPVVSDSITREFDQAVEEAQSRYGLIDRLPAPKEPTQAEFRDERGNPPVEARQRLDALYRDAIHGDVGAAYRLIAQYEQALRAGHVDPDTANFEEYGYGRVTTGLDTVALLEGWPFISDLMGAYEPDTNKFESPVVAAVGNVVARFVLRARQTGAVDDVPGEALQFLLDCSNAPAGTKTWIESTAVGWGIGHEDVSVTEAIHRALADGRDEWTGEVIRHALYADQHRTVERLESFAAEGLLAEASVSFIDDLPKSNAWPAGPTGSWWGEFGYRFAWDEGVENRVRSLHGA